MLGLHAGMQVPCSHRAGLEAPSPVGFEPPLAVDARGEVPRGRRGLKERLARRRLTCFSAQQGGVRGSTYIA